MLITKGKYSNRLLKFKEDLILHNFSVKNITDVSCDIYPAFIKGVKENLPDAEITFDKFHIMKIINDSVDEVRKQEQKTNTLLNKTRYIFLKNNRRISINLFIKE